MTFRRTSMSYNLRRFDYNSVASMT